MASEIDDGGTSSARLKPRLPSRLPSKPPALRGESAAGSVGARLQKLELLEPGAELPVSPSASSSSSPSPTRLSKRCRGLTGFFFAACFESRTPVAGVATLAVVLSDGFVLSRTTGVAADEGAPTMLAVAAAPSSSREGRRTFAGRLAGATELDGVETESVTEVAPAPNVDVCCKSISIAASASWKDTEPRRCKLPPWKPPVTDPRRSCIVGAASTTEPRRHGMAAGEAADEDAAPTHEARRAFSSV